MNITKHVDIFWETEAGIVRMNSLFVPGVTLQELRDKLPIVDIFMLDHPHAEVYRVYEVTLKMEYGLMRVVGYLLDVEEWVHPTDDPTGEVTLVYMCVNGYDQEWEESPVAHYTTHAYEAMENTLPHLLDRWQAYYEANWAAGRGFLNM